MDGFSLRCEFEADYQRLLPLLQTFPGYSQNWWVEYVGDTSYFLVHFKTHDDYLSLFQSLEQYMV